MTTLSVPGAEIYYEAVGSGPLLLMIVGGNGDAATYARVSPELADRYTVVSYDRRGFARSPINGPVDDGRYDADVEDAARLIDHLGGAPAYVFGSSSGAIVALDLLTRHPDRVRRVVAHEPPAVLLLPDAEARLAMFDDVYDTARREGNDVAMRKFSAAVGLETMPALPEGVELPPPVLEMISRIKANLGFWMEHELRQYTRVVPDLTALAAVTDRLVLAGGEDSRDHLPYLPNTVLAERLGVKIIDFPGGHVGYVTHPAEFAARLAATLAPRGSGGG
jgi:pimeloyl-ACP methyl ester carboxylesterase